MLQQLAGQTSWTIGSSFKLAPAPFKHCFVVGVLVRNQLIVAAHALMTENSEQLYMEALNAVVAAIRPTKPRRGIFFYCHFFIFLVDLKPFTSF